VRGAPRVYVPGPPSVYFPGPIKPWSIHKSVPPVKRALARAGHYPWKPRLFTPLAGPGFIAAVKNFQREVRIDPSGVYGTFTHEALRKTRRLGFPREWAFGAQEISVLNAMRVKYVNPFRHATGLVPERTDQGVDFGADAGAPIEAIGRMKITRATTVSGWPGPYGDPNGFHGLGGVVQGVLLEAGAHQGEEVYLAEFIHLHVTEGDIVEAGQPIASFYHSASSGVGIEFGWVRRGTNEPCSSDTSGRPTQGGINMTRWLDQLGCPTQEHFGAGKTTCPC
jgi:hypothetical protein